MKKRETRHAGMVAMLEKVHWSHCIGINLLHKKRSVRAMENAAEKTWREFVNRLSRMLRVNPKRMLWLAAFELGSSGFNPHLHALIGGPSRALSERELQAWCDNTKQAMQLSRIKVDGYVNGPNAIAYLFKERETSLDDDRWPMLSPNIPEMIRRRGRM